MKSLLTRIAKLIPATVLMFAFAIVGLAFSVNQFVSQAQGAPNAKFTLGANKTQVTAGEEFQYTVTISNESPQEQTSVQADVTLSDKISYKAGSGTIEKGGKTVSLPDAWVTDSVNAGTVAANQKVYVKFTVKVSDSAAVGDKIISSTRIKSDQFPEWEKLSFSIDVVSTDLRAQLKGGNFVKVANVTQGGGGWQDEEVSAAPGNVIEYSVWIENTGEHDARNVMIKANLPGKDQGGTHLEPSITLSSDNAESVTDKVSVYVSSPSFLEIYPGHAKISGKTDLYDCENECDFPEFLYHTPVNMGTVKTGSVVQIKFKSGLVNFGPPTTPTPSPTPTPTPTPSPSPTPEPGKDRSCFEARVFEDLNKNGKYDEGEPGLTWEIDWRRNADQTWTEYKTYDDKQGMGGRLCVDDEPDITTRLRVKDWCVPTTPTEQNGKLELKKTKYFEFGCTRSKPTVKKGQAPKQLPKTGSAGEILLGLSGSLTAIGTGLTIVRRRLTV